MQTRSWIRRSVGATAFIGALIAGAIGGLLSDRLVEDDAREPAATINTESTVLGDSLDIGSTLATLEDSVVSIGTTVQTQRGPFSVQGEGAGTGIVIDDDGHVLTNAHVVDGATSVTVTAGGQDRTATVIAADPAADIAVLAVDDHDDLVPVALATAESVNVGDDVLAIGNALALEGDLTVTRGIISATDRSIDTSTGTLSHLIQTDAAISSGNSGGPLVNASGEVIGINTAVAASDSTTQASNIGFAISIERAVEVADALLTGVDWA